MTSQELKSKCLQTRKDIINMISAVGSGHPGGSLSSVELMVGTYYTQMRVDPENPQNQSRDRFVLSKGHAAPCLYSILCRLGYFDEKELYSLRQIDGMLQGHPSVKTTPGIDASTGSLGQGCSIAVGMALASKCKGTDTRVYTILGDGECQEGQIWEAFMSAAHYKLDNLTIMIDWNGLQIDGSNDDVMSLGDLHAKCEAFGLDVIELADGNDIDAVVAALEKPNTVGKPKCILAHTVKGKGVSFMENQAGWHGKAPNAEQQAEALRELEA